jgi:hypothetical protein
MVAKNFFQHFLRHWFHWLMDQWSSTKWISKCIPKQRAKVQEKEKTKGLKEGRKEQRKWKKERKGEESVLLLLHVSYNEDPMFNFDQNIRNESKTNQ